jgi:hypothetical protein
MNKDLRFLASILDETNWPNAATSVRLDADGEVRFTGTAIHDFYPDDVDAAKDAFVPVNSKEHTGKYYSLQDILDARDTLENQPNKKKTYTVDEVIDELEIRQEIDTAFVALGFQHHRCAAGQRHIISDFKRVY